MYTFGWFSTGRDEAARELLAEAWKNIQGGLIPGRIEYVFCDRESGEDTESDRFIRLAKTLHIPVFSLSSRRFDTGVRKQNRELWRQAYHKKVMEVLHGQDVSTVVLAGYMLIVSAEMCRQLCLINLHPAEPGGPKGTWQEVIWDLISQGAERSGVMIHLVTEDLDEGPPLTYCTFPLKGKRFDPLWVEMGAKLAFMPLGEIIQEEGESNPLFREIRAQGAMREIPLLVMTMKALADGRLSVQEGKILDARGRETGSLCLTGEVEAYVGRPKGTN